MVGALVGGTAAQAVTGSAAAMLRGRLVHGPLRMVDTAGGLVAGAGLGLAVAWLAAVVALAQPSLGLRGDVQGSDVLPALLRAVPADEVLNALARFDPLPVLPSIADRALPPPDPSVLRSPGARRDRASVVRIEGSACGLDIQGSGWVVRPGIVATNAHVIAGEQDAQVEVPNGPTLTGVPIAVDAGNDVALLRVRGLAPAAAAALAACAVGRRRDPDRLPRERPADGRRRPRRGAGDGARPGRVRTSHPRPHGRAAARRAAARRQRRPCRQPRRPGRGDDVRRRRGRRDRRRLRGAARGDPRTRCNSSMRTPTPGPAWDRSPTGTGVR